MSSPKSTYMPPRIQVLVRNVSKSKFVVEELKITLAPGEEIDITDQAAEHHYTDSSVAWRAINEMSKTSLYKGVHDSPAKLNVRFVPAS